MEIAFVLLVAAATFGVCFLVDKGFTKLFRSQRPGSMNQAVHDHHVAVFLYFHIFPLSICLNITIYQPSLSLFPREKPP